MSWDKQKVGQPSSAAAGGVIRAATYNVHGHKGLDWRVNAERPLQVLKHLDLGLIALQEFVNEHTLGGEPLLTHWARTLDMQAVCAPAFERGGEVFGTAILSKFEILERHEHDLSLPGYRRRVLLEVLLRVGKKRVQATSIHLGVSPRERALQIDRLFELCSRVRADVHLFLGDFNEWHGYGAVERRFRTRFASGPRLATFPAVSPVVGLDRIWVHPRECLVETRVDTSVPARRASDHLPLVATIDLAREAAAGPDAARERATALSRA
jgi:endonuclease/exonuclease/phosphatase family metal-dependent hydrolase